MSRAGTRARRGGALLLVVAAVLLTGCSTIPTSTTATAVDVGSSASGSDRVADPKDTTDPYAVPVQFARASADPANDHAAARAYLTPGARKLWNTKGPLQIIEDNPDTVDVQVDYVRGIATLALRARQLGTLQSDGTFVADPKPLRVPLTLRRRGDGQWRITKLRPGVLVPMSPFRVNYMQRQLYFYDPTMRVLVPDLRWVRNERRPEALAVQLVDLLLAGPSKILDGAVRSAVPGTAAGTTTVRRVDNSLVVDLKQLGDLGSDQRRDIYRQVSDSLRTVSGQIQIQIDGQPLYDPQPQRRPDALVDPSPDDSGVVVESGLVRELENNVKIPGAAGSGAYRVSTAGLSTDGEQLAVIGDDGKGPVLRVGRYGARELAAVQLRARELTQPSWGLRNPKRPNGGGEVWTVVNGRQVVRVVSDQAGVWSAQPVEAPGLAGMGKISQLKLCRDGARFAAVVDGKLVLGSVRREPDSISLGGLAVLGGDASKQYVDVAWQDQDSFVVIRNDNGLSNVIEYSADGLLDEPYSSANLTPPLSVITAAPGRPVIVMDTHNMWLFNQESGDWRIKHSFGPNMVPIYPG